ncbi:hypothetical protein CMV_025241 [Castanea mollissima]|uniref:PPM-type phosphatase domain-containing protein n=1 Tax=Castanea mollissima TaxID=60419 RepID=A0A8J4VBN0_9ROSI|nr:hypothetical protein CMV_025241 [Castanea mollissima]
MLDESLREQSLCVSKSEPINGYASEHQGISENVIEKAFLPTEECFPSLVNKQWLKRGTREVTAIQLSTEHNANMESVRAELQSLHHHDSQIVVLKHKIWRVKGLIQVSRSIGDAYLKKAEFNREPLLPRFRLPKPFLKLVLSSEPLISVHKLHPEDQFLIFASDGLWEHLSNQEAVNIVVNYPRYEIARRLVKAVHFKKQLRKEK